MRGPRAEFGGPGANCPGRTDGDVDSPQTPFETIDRAPGERSMNTPGKITGNVASGADFPPTATRTNAA
jgi:hypothetical protein